MSPTGSEHAGHLREKIDSGEIEVGVVGLGYVGLPLALTFAEAGLQTLGFDIDDQKVASLSEGHTYIDHIEGDRVKSTVESGRLRATSDFTRLSEPDAILICVPTPLDEHREPDMRFVIATARDVRASLRPGQLVVLESTTYPGTTDELMRSVLDEAGLESGLDYFLAFSPEREDPGNPDWSTSSIPKIIGGVDDVSGGLAEDLYGKAGLQTVRVSSARAAEATKLTENIFRSVNIALVNELKTIYGTMGIDVWEVLDAAETKPFGFMRFDPGPGWGGHCIPIDPFYLSWKAREYGEPTRFIELAGEINISMTRYVVEKVTEALNAGRKPVNGSRILVLGLAYKPNVADDRESPSYRLMDLLVARGAEVEYHDPHIPVIPETREHAHWAGTESTSWDEETIRSFDLVLIATDHDALDFHELGRWADVVVDTRNAMATVEMPEARVWKA